MLALAESMAKDVCDWGLFVLKTFREIPNFLRVPLRVIDKTVWQRADVRQTTTANVNREYGKSNFLDCVLLFPRGIWRPQR